MSLLRQLLAIEPLIALFVTIGFGYLVGKIRSNRSAGSQRSHRKIAFLRGAEESGTA